MTDRCRSIGPRPVPVKNGSVEVVSAHATSEVRFRKGHSAAGTVAAPCVTGGGAGRPQPHAPGPWSRSRRSRAVGVSRPTSAWNLAGFRRPRAAATGGAALRRPAVARRGHRARQPRCLVRRRRVDPPAGHGRGRSGLDDQRRPTPVIVSVPPTEPGSADLPEGSGDSTTTTVDPGADTVVAPIEPGDGTDVAPAAPGDDSPLTTTPAATEPPTNDPDVVELPSAPTGGWPLRAIRFPVAGPVTYGDDWGDCRGGSDCPRAHIGNDVIGTRLQPLLATVDGTVTHFVENHPTAGWGIVITDASAGTIATTTSTTTPRGPTTGSMTAAGGSRRGSPSGRRSRPDR